MSKKKLRGGKNRYTFLRRDVLAALALLLLAIYLLLRFTPYGDLTSFLARPYSTRIYDRNGVLLQIVPLEDGMRREYVPLADMPPALAAVFIEAEDARFYYHFGVDLIAIARAAAQNLSAGRRVSGASTITMQLARIIAAPSGSGGPLARKIAEAFNALRLEARLGKKEILRQYLNSAPFAFQTEGVASAARNFFGTEIDMLSPAQVFCLAVIPRRPGAYNPIQNPAECRAAAELLQKRFAERRGNRRKYPLFAAVTDADWDFALGQAKRFDYPFEMPHLVRRVTQDSPAAPALTLSADIYLQHYLEGLIADAASRYRGQRLNTGAAIALDNGTGEVLAWVGSAGFGDKDGGQIDGVLALNQSGSSMKPLLYALAIERGIPPASVLADVPQSFGAEEIYVPQNFNRRFNGPVLMRDALASSLNIPAVGLLERVGVRDYGGFLLRLGFGSLAGDAAADAGLGLALGNAPVSLLELARAFSVFPNDGSLLELRFTLNDGAPDSAPPASERVISPDTARIICSFLSDRDARYMGFGRARNFAAAFPVIVKTGTANQYQSIVALAASRRYTCAVWMGNFAGETVMGKTGSSVPAAAARDALVFLHERDAAPPETLAFREPERFAKAPVCAVSGLIPSADCPAAVREYVEAGRAPPVCGWHGRENGVPSVRYPAEYQGWLLAARRSGGLQEEGPLEIVTPRDGFVFFAAPGGVRRQAIPAEVTGGGAAQLRVAYDGAEWTEARPFRFFLPLERGTHTLSVRCGEEAREVRFTVQ